MRRDELLEAMRALESAGVPTRFPHVSHLYRVLLSKDWCGHLCLCPQFKVPATTKVSAAAVAVAARLAARTALGALRARARARGPARAQGAQGEAQEGGRERRARGQSARARRGGRRPRRRPRAAARRPAATARRARRRRRRRARRARRRAPRDDDDAMDDDAGGGGGGGRRRGRAGARGARGVAKLGFSWEASDVRSFEGEAQLATRLEQLFLQAQCGAECALVQERVEGAACEMRAFVVDGPSRTPSTRSTAQGRAAAAQPPRPRRAATPTGRRAPRRVRPPPRGGGGDDGGDGGGGGGGCGDDGGRRLPTTAAAAAARRGRPAERPVRRFSTSRPRARRRRVGDGDDAASGTKLRPESLSPPLVVRRRRRALRARAPCASGSRRAGTAGCAASAPRPCRSSPRRVRRAAARARPRRVPDLWTGELTELGASTLSWRGGRPRDLPRRAAQLLRRRARRAELRVPRPRRARGDAFAHAVAPRHVRFGDGGGDGGGRRAPPAALCPPAPPRAGQARGAAAAPFNKRGLTARRANTTPEHRRSRGGPPRRARPRLDVAPP